MKITLLEGDGIGPEVIGASKRCIEATNFKVEWEKAFAGENAIKKYKTPLPRETINIIKKNKVALKGPITTPVGKGFRSVNVALRKELDLFANVRPAKTFEGVKSNFKNIDLVVIRENLEDLYSGIEYDVGKFPKLGKDKAVSLKIISKKNTRRIANFAFDYATKNKRKKVTIVHKANILKFTDGLFLRLSKDVSKKYKIKVEDRIVDNMCMQLVQKPELYDVLLCPNLYGDIISDLCSGLVGGLGITGSANIGKSAIFEPVHGSAPKYKGKNKVNPTAAILSGVYLLRYLNKNKEANRIENAVKEVIRRGRKVTYDINPRKPVSTSKMTDAIIDLI